MSDELNRKPVFVTSHNTDLDSEYVQWVQEIKERYRNVQIKAAVKVNSEQLMFNWQLGQDLVRRKAEERWGSGIVEQLSLDLQNCLDADMFHHTGNALTNFDQILPETQSKLAQEIIKDNYDLSFITLPKNYDETMLEEALEQNITRFLLELGTGFSFVGRQKEINQQSKSKSRLISQNKNSG